MGNKEAFKENLLEEIENAREQIIIEIDKQMMGLYDTLTEYLNEEHDEETNQEANELSVLIADQIHAKEDESRAVDEQDEEEASDDVTQLSHLIKEQAKTEPPSPKRAIRPVTDLIADLVLTVNQETNEATEENMNQLVEEASAEPSNREESTEDLSAKIKQAILVDNIKKQLQ